MSDTVIRVEGLGKRYRIGAARERYVALRDVLARGARSVGRRLLGRGAERPTHQDFWALKDVSFEVRQGECVGIIGRNGAGKSTLLKLLSRITEPTEGRFRIRGRMASLLEVGTGFHPELTGRENVYLNGAILGMRRAEINRKFDEIVAFAEIAAFLDTPVKYYSSGMYMRLAFAVAAHLEPEILVVDEVLAVGDVEFQKKCLGKMGEVVGRGRTVLFVSHNMTAIRALCSRAVVLGGGQRVFDGSPQDAIPVYLDQPKDLTAEWRDDRMGKDEPSGPVRITGVRVRRADGTIADQIPAFEAFDVEIDYTVSRPAACQIAFRFNRSDGETLFTSGDGDAEYIVCQPRSPDRYRSRARIPGHFVAPGRYFLLVAANQPRDVSFDILERVLNIEVDTVGSLRQLEQRFGVVMPMLDWTQERLGVPDGTGARTGGTTVNLLRRLYEAVTPLWARRRLSLCHVLLTDPGSRKRWLWARQVARLTRRGSTLVTANLSHARLTVDIRDEFIGRSIYFDGVWEPAETAYLKSALRPGMVVYDVGANIGYMTTLAASMVGTDGLVVAFEPDPFNFDLLRQNASQNQFRNIRLLNLALGSEPATLKLYRSDSNFGDHRLYSNGSGARPATEVRVERLDDVRRQGQLPIPDFIKIDVQGYEPRVLGGMPELVSSGRPLVLLVEFWPGGIRNAGGDPEAVLATFRETGFRVARLTLSGELVPTDWPDLHGFLETVGVYDSDSYENLVFLRP